MSDSPKAQAQNSTKTATSWSSIIILQNSSSSTGLASDIIKLLMLLSECDCYDIRTVLLCIELSGIDRHDFDPEEPWARAHHCGKKGKPKRFKGAPAQPSLTQQWH